MDYTINKYTLSKWCFVTEIQLLILY